MKWDFTSRRHVYIIHVTAWWMVVRQLSIWWLSFTTVSSTQRNSSALEYCTEIQSQSWIWSSLKFGICFDLVLATGNLHFFPFFCRCRINIKHLYILFQENTATIILGIEKHNAKMFPEQMHPRKIRCTFMHVCVDFRMNCSFTFPSVIMITIT